MRGREVGRCARLQVQPKHLRFASPCGRCGPRRNATTKGTGGGVADCVVTAAGVSRCSGDMWPPGGAYGVRIAAVEAA